MKAFLKKIGIALLAFIALWLIVSFVDIALLAPWNTDDEIVHSGMYGYTGVIHVHSRHSDGGGFLPEIHLAARKNNLDFLFISDHNVLTLLDSAALFQQPLVIVGTELTLGYGHLFSYGLQTLPEQFSEAKMGGFQAILDTLKKKNGLAIVSHPFHPKIRWKSDTLAAEIDGIEILNADVEWRNDRAGEILAAFIAFPFFDHAMNLLLDVPERELAFWDEQTIDRRLVGIGSADAHANIKLGSGRTWAFPSYQKTFSLVQDVVLLRDTLSSSVETATAQIVEAIRSGNVLFGFASLGSLHQVRIWSEGASNLLLPGDQVQFQDEQTLFIELPDIGPTETRLYKDGQMIAVSREQKIEWQLEQAGSYRVAVFQLRRQFPYISQRAIPWLFANPFYLYE